MKNLVTFEGSSARSHAAPRFDMIPLCVLERLAARFELGAKKYSAHGWKQGGPLFERQCALHLVEHLWSYLEGKPDNDQGSHLDAVLWNAAALVWFDEQAKRAGPAQTAKAQVKLTSPLQFEGRGLTCGYPLKPNELCPTCTPGPKEPQERCEKEIYAFACEVKQERSNECPASD
jgi:hypothetical protein